MNTYAAYHVLYGGVDPWGMSWWETYEAVDKWVNPIGYINRKIATAIVVTPIKSAYRAVKSGEKTAAARKDKYESLAALSECPNDREKQRKAEEAVERARQAESENFAETGVHAANYATSVPGTSATGPAAAPTRPGAAGTLGRVGANSTGKPKPVCFVAGTKVLTSSGLKSIEKIQIGELVWSYNTETGEWELKEVLQVFIHDYQGDLIQVVVKGKLIEASGNHPFWVVAGKDLEARPPPADVYAHERGMTDKGRWVEARDLKPGDRVLLRSGDIVAIESTIATQAQAIVYNFYVEDLHTYSVGEHGVLVHNKPVRWDAPIPKQGVPGWTPPAVRKGVNTDLPHAVERAVERGVCPDPNTAGDALRELSKKFKAEGLPPGTVPDPKRADSVLVPFENGYAVYEIQKNGNAVLRTVIGGGN